MVAIRVLAIVSISLFVFSDERGSMVPLGLEAVKLSQSLESSLVGDSNCYAVLRDRTTIEDLLIVTETMIVTETIWCSRFGIT